MIYAILFALVYVSIGAVFAFMTMIYGRRKRWSTSDLEAGPVLMWIFWPLAGALFFPIIGLATLWTAMNEKAEAIAEKSR